MYYLEISIWLLVIVPVLALLFTQYLLNHSIIIVDKREKAYLLVQQMHYQGVDRNMMIFKLEKKFDLTHMEALILIDNALNMEVDLIKNSSI